MPGFTWPISESQQAEYDALHKSMREELDAMTIEDWVVAGRNFVRQNRGPDALYSDPESHFLEGMARSGSDALPVLRQYPWLLRIDMEPERLGIRNALIQLWKEIRFALSSRSR